MNDRYNLIENPSDKLSDDIIFHYFPKRCINKVLLISPPEIKASLYNIEKVKNRAYTNYPPYGLLVIAKHLKKINIEVHVVNLQHYLLEKIYKLKDDEIINTEELCKQYLEQEIKKFKPDLIGLTCMFSISIESFLDTAKFISLFGIPVAVGGIQPTYESELIFNRASFINMIFIREAEVSFKRFIKIVNNKEELNQLSQLYINFNNNIYFYSDVCIPNEEELNIIPSYDLINISDYSKYGIIGSFYHLHKPGTQTATVLASRGCRARCTFCSARSFNGLKVRQRSIKSVVDEIELLYNHYNIRHIMWLDDDLFKNSKRIINLFNEITHRQLKITWDATNGVLASSCTNEVIAAAAASGCIGLNIGVESGNEEILKQIKKPGNRKTFLNASSVLRQYEDIVSSVFIIIGFPNEKIAQIKDTIDLCKKMNLDSYSIGTLQVLPGTPIYENMISEGLIKKTEITDRRYILGPNGKASQHENHFDKEKFDINLLPDDKDLTENDLKNIWFYMDYILNYEHIFYESRTLKIKQKLKQLRKISNLLYIDHAFALYFTGYLQFCEKGKIDKDIIFRLEKKLESSRYWKQQFNNYGLSLEHLKLKYFPQLAFD